MHDVISHRMLILVIMDMADDGHGVIICGGGDGMILIT